MGKRFGGEKKLFAYVTGGGNMEGTRGRGPRRLLSTKYARKSPCHSGKKKRGWRDKEREKVKGSTDPIGGR